MKIIQINAWSSKLHHQLLNLIEEQNPDIVCLQEIYSSNIKIGIEKDAYTAYETLKNKLGYGYFSATWSFDYLGQKVDYGNAIVSKLPIKNPKTAFTNGIYSNLTKSIPPNFLNIRNVQSCEIYPQNKKLVIVNHHGYHELNSNGSQKSIDSMKQVIKHIKTINPSNSPLLFCGDLNLNPTSKPIELLESSFEFNNLVKESAVSSTLSDLFRISNLAVVCDYIFASDKIKVNKFLVSPKIVSDHKALVLDFELT